MSNLPRWICHKEVGAARIVSVAPNLMDFGYVISLATGARVEVPHEWIAKHSPQVGGYLVEYEDGYRSYSPATAFESGYSPILTDADAAADLAGKPRPDHPGPSTAQDTAP